MGSSIKVKLVLFSLIPEGEFLTIILQLAFLPFAVFAWIVAVPAFFAVTFPNLFTEAVLGRLERNVTFVAAYDGVKEYFKENVSPVTKVFSFVLSLIAFGFGAVTLILQLAFFPFAVLALMVTFPDFFAVTFPEESTVATALLLLAQVTLE